MARGESDIMFYSAPETVSLTDMRNMGPIRQIDVLPGGAGAKKRPKAKTVKTAKKRRTKRQAVVAGWREWAAIPEFDVRAIKVKLDTGARTSALHAWNIRPFERDGEDWVSFELHPVQRNNAVRIPCEAPIIGRRSVRSTSGKAETRYVIRTTVMLGGREKRIEVTLTNRDEMGFRMLIGRTAMRRWIIVDPSRSFLHGARPDKPGVLSDTKPPPAPEPIKSPAPSPAIDRAGEEE